MTTFRTFWIFLSSLLTVSCSDRVLSELKSPRNAVVPQQETAPTFDKATLNPGEAVPEDRSSNVGVSQPAPIKKEDKAEKSDSGNSSPLKALITGAGPTGGAHILAFDASANTNRFVAEWGDYRGGVHVAGADLNGDGISEFIAATATPLPNIGPSIVVYDGNSGVLLAEITPYLRKSVACFIATGDINDDGVPDIIASAGPGEAQKVKIYDGSDFSLIDEFFAFAEGFQGGATVASGDVDGDGQDDLIFGVASGTPRVRVVSGDDFSEIGSFLAYAFAFQGGVNVAAADFNSDGLADILTGAGKDGGPHVKIFDSADLGGRLLENFFAYDAAFTGGVNVAAGDIDGDGVPDVITGAGFTGGPHVRVLSGVGLGMIADFFAYNPEFRGGVYVGAY